MIRLGITKQIIRRRSKVLSKRIIKISKNNDNDKEYCIKNNIFTFSNHFIGLDSFENTINSYKNNQNMLLLASCVGINRTRYLESIMKIERQIISSKKIKEDLMSYYERQDMSIEFITYI